MPESLLPRAGGPGGEGGGGGEGPTTASDSASESASAGGLSIALSPRNLRLVRLLYILRGDLLQRLHFEFFTRRDQSDFELLSRLRRRVGRKDSPTHLSVLLAHGVLCFGSARARFFRTSRRWIEGIGHWGKMALLGTIGLVNHGNTRADTLILEAYLPGGGPARAGGGRGARAARGSGGFVQAGGLYALGLIHARHAAPHVVNYLVEVAQAPSRDTPTMVDPANRQTHALRVLHGAALALGLVALGTHNTAIAAQLQEIAATDEVVSGLAASIAAGMVLRGAMPPAATTPEDGGAAGLLEELQAQAVTTTHPRLTLGLGLGLALAAYGRAHDADAWIDRLYAAQDNAELRRAACSMLAMAYVGTARPEALRRLLHITVSDVSSGVRRAAVTAVGFLLLLVPHRCPELLRFLIRSYNPHVRYGAAMALGIACAGTGLPDTATLLAPLLDDTEPFVVLGASTALAMVLQHQTGPVPPAMVGAFLPDFAPEAPDTAVVSSDSTQAGVAAVATTADDEGAGEADARPGAGGSAGSLSRSASARRTSRPASTKARPKARPKSAAPPPSSSSSSSRSKYPSKAGPASRPGSRRGSETEAGGRGSVLRADDAVGSNDEADRVLEDNGVAPADSLAYRLRSKLLSMLDRQHLPILTQFGVALGCALLAAGGGNAVVRPVTPLGRPDADAVTGLLLFSHGWDWFPLYNMIALALRPACRIVIDTNMAIPAVQLQLPLPLARIGYLPHLLKYDNRAKDKTVVLTAELSTTKQVRARLVRKRKMLAQAMVDVDPGSSPKPKNRIKEIDKVQDLPHASSDQHRARQGTSSEPHAAALTDRVGQTSRFGRSATTPTLPHMATRPWLANPARIVPAQAKQVAFPPMDRYSPALHSAVVGSVLVVHDTESAAHPPDLIGYSTAVDSAAAAEPYADEPLPPAPIPLPA